MHNLLNAERSIPGFALKTSYQRLQPLHLNEQGFLKSQVEHT